MPERTSYRPFPPVFSKMLQQKLDELPDSLTEEQKRVVREHFAELLRE